MEFTKVKYKDETVELAWTTPNAPSDQEGASATTERHEMSCPDEPEGRFVKALRRLKGDALYVLEMKEEPGQEVEVTTVSTSKDRNGNRRHQMSMRVKCEAGTYSITTPLLREPTDEVPEGANTLTADQAKRIRKVHTHAARYVDGLRSQRDLFEGEEEESEETAGAGA